MIPNFLQSLADQVRAFVASGKALHVNEATVAELEILAGLDWGACRLDFACVDEDGSTNGANREEWTQQPMPADIAWAWLKLSLAQPSREWVQYEQDVVPMERIQEDSAKRAAECAELATICERVQAEPIAHISLADARIPVYRGMTGDLITQLLRGSGSGATASGTATLPATSPHRGTREGARAAWGHIAACTQGQIADRYLRELEAM